MRDAPTARSPADPAAVETVLAALQRAGLKGATASDLQLEQTPPSAVRRQLRTLESLPNRRALAWLMNEGRVYLRKDHYFLGNAVCTADAVAEHLLLLTRRESARTMVLWRKAELARALNSTLRPMLDEALGHLEDRRELLRFPDGSRSERFLFVAPLRRWLAEEPLNYSAQLSAPPADLDSKLRTVYPKLVRESGGFPDVKIAALHRALRGVAPAIINDRLRSLWFEGRATLSLGDWSLASEEIRNAAVELDGERYLLVRLEDSSDASFPD